LTDGPTPIESKPLLGRAWSTQRQKFDEFEQNPEAPRPAGELARITAAQASALMKSALAISNELMTVAFPEICKAILDELSGTWDFDVSSPLVQRLLSSKSTELNPRLPGPLREAQDQTFHEITVGRVQLAPAALDAETLSTGRFDLGRKQHRGRAPRQQGGGLRGPALRDLNLVVAYVIGRSRYATPRIRSGPNVYVRALLRAAEQCDLHKEAMGVPA